MPWLEAFRTSFGYSYFKIKLMKCENLFGIFVAYESMNLETCENFEKSICGNFNY